MCFIGMTNNSTFVLAQQWQVRQQSNRVIRVWLVSMALLAPAGGCHNYTILVQNYLSLWWPVHLPANRFFSVCCFSCHTSREGFTREGFETSLNLILFLSFNRVPMFRNVGNGLRPYRRLPDHSFVPHWAHLGVRECPSVDQPFRMDVVAAAPAVCGWVAADRSGWGETGPRVDHPGRQTPWKQGIHEEVSAGLQQQRIWLENGDGCYWQQAQGKI